MIFTSSLKDNLPVIPKIWKRILPLEISFVNPSLKFKSQRQGNFMTGNSVYLIKEQDRFFDRELFDPVLQVLILVVAAILHIFDCELGFARSPRGSFLFV